MNRRFSFPIGASGTGLLLALCMASMNLAAAPLYQLSSQRYFGEASGRVSNTGSQPFTSATNAELPISYNDGNVYLGRSAIRNGSVVMEAKTSVAINQQVTTDNVLGELARDRVVFYDSLVVTGGTGTAYLSPVVHISGTFNDGSSLLVARLDACFGTSTCTILSVPGGFSTGGAQAFDLVWSPSPSVNPPGFEITFGDTETAFMFFGAAVFALGGTGVDVPAGNSASADFEFVLQGYRVLDENGDLIPGAVVHSEALTAQAPEPESAAMGAIGLALFLAFSRRKR